VRIIYIKCLIITIFVFNLYPQEDLKKDTIALDLQKSIELAIEFNHDLKLAKLEEEKAEEQVREAWGSSVFPNISGNINYNRAIKRAVIIIDAPEFGFSGSFPQGTENTLTAGATLEQPLFTGAIFLAVRVAQTYAEIQNKMVDATKSEVIVNVKKAYYSVLLAKEVLELANLNYRLAQDNREDTEKMYNAGVVPQYDLVRSRVQEKNLIPEVNQAENSLLLAENLLKFVTGLELTQPIKIIDSLKLEEMPVSSYDESVQRLLSNNFQLRSLELQINLQDDNTSYQFTKHLPELYLNGSWQAQAQENDVRPFSRWRYFNSVYVGLNLKVPLFDGFQTSSRVEQAKIDLLKAKEEYNRTVKALKNNLLDVTLSINQKKEELEAQKATIEEAQLAYDISVSRYASGVGTQLETIDAMVSLSRAKVNYYTAIYDYYILQAQLNQLLSRESE
jgi:outer membrane protein TolC